MPAPELSSIFPGQITNGLQHYPNVVEVPVGGIADVLGAAAANEVRLEEVPADETVFDKAKTDAVAGLLDGLNLKEKYIVEAWIGWVGEPRRLSDIAKEFGASRQVVHCAKNRALKKMKVMITEQGLQSLLVDDEKEERIAALVATVLAKN